MSKNLIPQIAQMLGVEPGEKFKVKGYNELTCIITNDKGVMARDGSLDTEWVPANVLFIALLNGKGEIIKLPWRPDYRQMYWTFGLKDGIWVVVPREWEDYPAEILLADKGWAYRSKEEAEDALPRVAVKLGVDYKL